MKPSTKNLLLILGCMFLGMVCNSNVPHVLAQTVAGWLRDGIPASNVALAAAKGSVVSGDGTRYVETAAGANGKVLSADSTKTGGVDWITAASAPPFADNSALIKNNGDNTKLAIIDASLITTGTTRTYTLPNSSSSFVVGPTAGPVTIAGPSAARTVTFPDAAFTVARTDAANTFTGASSTTSWAMTTQVVTSGLTASGSASNDFSGSTGTFKSSTGANTLGGAVSIADATTPSLTTAAGKTNTGFLQINGKTSGAFKLTAADAAAQTVTFNLAAQTVGAATLTLPDMANTNKTLAWLESPSFTTPTLGTPASATLTNCTGLPEGGLSFTDITTNNSSTSKHGLLLKLDNTAAHYMDGTGAWSTPGGGTSTSFSTSARSETGSTTLIDDVDFSFAIAANEKWSCDLWLIINSSDGTGVKFGFTGPASPTLVSYTAQIQSVSSAFTTVATSFGTGVGSGAINFNEICSVHFSVQNGANAGTVQFQFAQVSASGGCTMTIKAGSTMVARKF